MNNTYFINKTRWPEDAIAKAWRAVVVVARALRAMLEARECPRGLLGEGRGPGIPMRFPASALCTHGSFFRWAVYLRLVLSLRALITARFRSALRFSFLLPPPMLLVPHLRYTYPV